jgi:hypothetical protein
VSQVSILVECPRIDAVMGPFHAVKSENRWEVDTKVIMRRKKQVMLSPPGGDLHVRIRILERHIMLPCLVPLYTFSFELFQEL